MQKKKNKSIGKSKQKTSFFGMAVKHASAEAVRIVNNLRYSEKRPPRFAGEPESVVGGETKSLIVRLKASWVGRDLEGKIDSYRKLSSKNGLKKRESLFAEWINEDGAPTNCHSTQHLYWPIQWSVNI